MTAKLSHDFCSSGTSQVTLIRREGDGPNTSMTSATVTLTNLRQVDHLLRTRLGPGIGTNRNLRTKTRLAQAHTIRRVRMQKIRNKLVITLKRLIGNVKVQRAILRLSALRDQSQRLVMTLQQRRKKLRHKRLLQNLAKTHGRQQRDQFWNKRRVLARFNPQGQLHGGLRHFNSGLGTVVESAIHNVSPVDQIGNRRSVKPETRLGDMGNEAGAGGVVRIVELAIARAPILLLAEKMLLIRRSKKRTQMMIEPPGYARRSAVLEVDNRVFVAGKIRLLKQRSSAVHQPVKIIVRVPADAFAVETREQRSRTSSVKTPVVIKNANLQT